MTFNVVADWRLVVALGAATVGIIFAVKMDASEAERVSIKMLDTCRSLAVASDSNC